MTLAEIGRYMEAYEKRKRIEQEEKAYFDYIQADLIGKSIARIYSKKAEMPKIEEVYTTLFKSEDFIEQKQKAEMQKNIDSFKAFALNFNKHFKTEQEKEG